MACVAARALQQHPHIQLIKPRSSDRCVPVLSCVVLGLFDQNNYFFFSLPIFSFRILMPNNSHFPAGADSLGICGGEGGLGGALYVHHNLVAGSLALSAALHFTSSLIVSYHYSFAERPFRRASARRLHVRWAHCSSRDGHQQLCRRRTRAHDASGWLHLHCVECTLSQYSRLGIRTPSTWCYTLVSALLQQVNTLIMHITVFACSTPSPSPLICSDAVLRFLVDAVLFVAQVTPPQPLIFKHTFPPSHVCHDMLPLKLSLSPLPHSHLSASTPACSSLCTRSTQ